jgi:DNA-binding transcriptional LysR family regulator
MTLEQLRIFAAVARAQHLTRAARDLNLTPSAVSSAIRVLEERYGVALFDRVGRGIELTEAGRIVQAEAEAVLARAGAAEMIMTELGGLRRGFLRLQASQTIASYWLPRHLLEFHRLHPDVELDLAVGNTATVSAAVKAGSTEIGLVEGEIDDPVLSTRPVATDRLIVVVAPDHPWTGRSRLTVNDATKTTWIMRESGSGTRSVFEARLRASGIDPAALTVGLVLPSNEAVRTAVELGSGAAVVSRLVVEAHLAAHRLVEVRFPLLERTFQLVRHRERHSTKASLAFERVISGQI